MRCSISVMTAVRPNLPDQSSLDPFNVSFTYVAQQSQIGFLLPVTMIFEDQSYKQGLISYLYISSAPPII